MDMEINFAVVLKYWLPLLKGVGLTSMLTMTCALIGTVLGFLINVIRMLPYKILRVPVDLYVEFFRGTPLLIQLFWIFFCVPVLLGVSISPYISVMISLTLFMAAITSETFRGGLKSISSDQYDACVALGLPSKVKVVSVIFPQALLRSVPSLLSNVISLFKESALISSVGVADLMFVGQNLSNTTARPFEFLTAVAVIYFCIAFPLTRLVGVIEARMLRKLAY